MRFVVLAFGSAELPAGITLGSVDTATSVQDRTLRDGAFEGPTSAPDAGVFLENGSDESAAERPSASGNKNALIV